jgi:hypothetical protein
MLSYGHTDLSATLTKSGTSLNPMLRLAPNATSNDVRAFVPLRPKSQ